MKPALRYGLLAAFWLANCGEGELPAPVTLGPEWTVLLDHNSLGQWQVTEFGGQGRVEVQAGRLHLAWGNDLTGVTWSGALPRIDYELTLDAMRTQGNDFFCGLTFAVADSHCTLVVGGWGGGTVGLSTLDGRDASENETTRRMRFQDQRWYNIRLRVTATRVIAWIDGEQVLNVPAQERRFDVRPEVRLSRPLGIATWRTSAAFRNIGWRRLEPE